MASLVQDVWLGFGPRLRARRLAPWEEAPVRVVFCPARDATLDDPLVEAFLEGLSEHLDVIAWEPPGQGASAGRPGPETLDHTRRLVAEAPGRFGHGPVPVVVGGHGLGGWLALAAADAPEVVGAFALDPAFAPDDPRSPEASSLTEALVAALDRSPLQAPTLVLEARGRADAEGTFTDAWVAREPRASRGSVATSSLLEAPWIELVRAWVVSVGSRGRGPS